MTHIGTRSVHRHKFPADFGALAASLGTLAAMVHVGGMFFAFVGAGIAKLGAEVAHLFGKRAVASHVGSGQIADFGAVPVKSDTGNHHLNVRFVQASLLTTVARKGATQTSIDTIL